MRRVGAFPIAEGPITIIIMNLEQKVLETTNRYGMINKGEKVLVGVSGGPDSVCLIHILANLRSRLDMELFIAHLDHNVRGRFSASDARFVKKLAGTLGIKCYSRRLKMPGKIKSYLSPEELLREKRYSFFRAVASRLSIRTVATGHTLDEQAETVLMRIIKGSTLRGLIGIHPVREDATCRFIRPLIEAEKMDVKQYLKKGNIPYRVDSTNLENKFLRNRVRNRVFPYLEKINPRLKRSLYNLSESLREDFNFIKEEKKKRQLFIKTGRLERSILLSDMLFQPKALQRELARDALDRSGANIKKLTFRHWRDIDSLIRVKNIGKSIDIPGSVRIIKESDRIIFSKRG